MKMYHFRITNPANGVRPKFRFVFLKLIAFACNSWLKKRSQNPNYEGELRLTNDSNAGFATPVETVKAICKVVGGGRVSME